MPRLNKKQKTNGLPPRRKIVKRKKNAYHPREKLKNVKKRRSSSMDNEGYFNGKYFPPWRKIKKVNKTFVIHGGRKSF